MIGNNPNKSKKVDKLNQALAVSWSHNLVNGLSKLTLK